MSDYEVQKKLGRFIVYRVTEGKHLRQGSFTTEREAYERINESIKLMSNS